MKVGIMTMQRIPNYGSFMQALSLKKIVEELGYDVSFVDYHVEPCVYDRNSIIKRLKCIFHNSVKDILTTSFFLPIYRHYKGTDSIFSCNDLLGIDDHRRYKVKVDTLIIGSDEVFNCTQKGGRVGYSLELFGKDNNSNRLISYAASFGSTSLDIICKLDIDSELSKYLRRFDAISVRDLNSFKIVKALTGAEASVNLDPVLIGGIEYLQWEDAPYSYIRKDFIVLYGYSYRFSKTECEFIKEFAEKRNLDVICLGEKQFCFENYIRCKPSQLFYYFKKAKYIITDTFHGTIFSIIFHKKFVTIPRKNSENNSGNYEKIAFMLEQLDLFDRLLQDWNILDSLIDKEINYQHVDSLRETERVKSLNYLKNNISEFHKHAT